MHRALLSLTVLAAVALLAAAPSPALAASDCVFVTRGSTMRLAGDCTTDATIFIPPGLTLDGRGHTITAVDPPGGHFLGAVVQAGGSVAHVRDLVVTAAGLANVCDAGADRLRGIMFEAASGSVTHSTVIGINQGPSGCQEGNAIEVRNAPFDGSHPNTQRVEIAHTSVDGYQKTGIVANGDVEVDIHHNDVGASATQQNLAANSIQLGFGALGVVAHNRVDGNQWLGPSNFAASAILAFATSPGAVIDKNNIGGNSDVGLFLVADGLFADNNKIFDVGADGPHGDWGIVNLNATFTGCGANTITNNKVRGFDTPQFCVSGGNNKAIPGGPKAFE